MQNHGEEQGEGRVAPRMALQAFHRQNKQERTSGRGAQHPGDSEGAGRRRSTGRADQARWAP